MIFPKTKANVGNRIEFLIASFYWVLNGKQYTFIEQSFLYVEIENKGNLLVKVYTILKEIFMYVWGEVACIIMIGYAPILNEYNDHLTFLRWIS